MGICNSNKIACSAARRGAFVDPARGLGEDHIILSSTQKLSQKLFQTKSSLSVSFFFNLFPPFCFSATTYCKLFCRTGLLV
mmetsp:Transcript_10282/g.18849  ORF Transcript_10282/g.18849 Transcript_10282/m.18849 type:complete len:81 (-) Transcript_10282:197-439(-)